VLVQTALMLAGGGEACSDIGHLRLGENLSGAVPSDTTVARMFHEITSSTRTGIADAMAEMRGEVSRRSSLTTGTGPVILDIDASLVEIHSENKEQSAATFKGGFGFHPMFCFADDTGETANSTGRCTVPVMMTGVTDRDRPMETQGCQVHHCPCSNARRSLSH